MSESFTSPDAATTEAIGRAVGVRLGREGVVLLFGPLGAGKTVFARGMAAALGIDPASIQSPTFTLVNEHEGTRGHMTHVDLYRLSPAEAEAMGIDDVLASPGIRVVEWAERLPAAPPGAVSVRFERPESGERILRVEGLAPAVRPAVDDGAHRIGSNDRMEEAFRQQPCLR